MNLKNSGKHQITFKVTYRELLFFLTCTYFDAHHRPREHSPDQPDEGGDIRATERDVDEVGTKTSNKINEDNVCQLIIFQKKNTTKK